MDRILILLSIVILSGCSAGGTKFTESKFTKTPNQTEIFVFRLDKLAASGSCYEIGLNDNAIGVLGNGGFIRKEVSPGKNIISVPMSDKTNLELNFDGKENETLYFQFSIALNDAKAIPDSKIISNGGDYIDVQGELLDFNSLFAQVEELYALNELKLLRDSSVKVSCMGTLNLKN
jgi:hypothetical protein